MVLASRSVSGVLFPGALRRAGSVTIHLCSPPVGSAEAQSEQLIPRLGLAPDGVYRAAVVAHDAGALLPHRFTLTCAGSLRPSAVYFLLH